MKKIIFKHIVILIILSILAKTYALDTESELSNISNYSIGIECGDKSKNALLETSIQNLKNHFGDELENEMIKYIGDFSRSGEQLVGASYVINLIGTKKSFNIMLDAMGKLPSGLMVNATEFVAKSNEIGLAEKLLKLETNEKDEDRKNCLINAMCNLSGKDQFVTIVTWANSTDLELRRRAIQSLKNYNNDESRKIVVKNLFEDNEKLMYSAILSLGEIGTRNEVLLFQYKLITNKATGFDAIGLLSAIKQSTEKIALRSKIKQ